MRRTGDSPGEQLEQLRQEMADGLSAGRLTRGGLEHWERVILLHGEATRYRPAALLIDDLTTDFTELGRLFRACRSPSTARHLVRLVAQIAGLISLTLLKVGDRPGSRNWAHTAWLAADEAGDGALQSWVRAQQAYAYFYSSDPESAIRLARRAQQTARPSVGAALACALEARAWAARRRISETLAALDRAERALAALDDDELTASAFGYSEAQLRFHQGNALTRALQVDRAEHALALALSLYPEEDYLDRALVCLDQAACLMARRDLSGGLAHIAVTIAELDEDRRDPLIISRAKEVIATIPPADRGSRGVLELQSLLLLAAGDQE